MHTPQQLAGGGAQPVQMSPLYYNNVDNQVEAIAYGSPNTLSTHAAQRCSAEKQLAGIMIV
jgi:hypothetical protein